MMKLKKTMLTNKPHKRSFFVGLFSFATLLLLYKNYDPLLSANAYQVFNQGEYWRAFTTSLLHGSIEHLGSNSLFFFGLAMLLNHYFSWIVFPVLSFLAGGLINIITLRFYPPDVTLVGISGVIYFMASFWLTLYVLIERKQSISTRFIQAIGAALIFFFPEVFDIKVSYLAHAVGVGLGIPFALMYFGVRFKFIRSQEVWEKIEPPSYWEAEYEALEEKFQIQDAIDKNEKQVYHWE